MRIATTTTTLLCILLLAGRGVAAAADTLRVGVAVSLKEPLTEIASAYEAQSGQRVELSFGSSGQISAQIAGGAGIDVFISAANKQVDDLNANGLIDPATRRVVAGNTLVLIVPRVREGSASISSFAALTEPSIRKIVIGEPKTVPAGQYAQQALQTLSIAPSVAGKLVYGSNVRQVLDYVTRGEVDAGLVYATDAKLAGDTVTVVAAAPTGSHEPIVYTAVVVKAAPNSAAARSFVDYLASERAAGVLRSWSYTVSDTPTSQRTSLWQPLGLSLRIAVVATVFTVLLGTPLAFAMARRAFVGRSLIEGFILLPLVLPPTVVGYFIVMALGSRGWFADWLGGYSVIFRFEGAVLAALIVALPMLYMPAKAAFGSVDREFEDAARLMGASRLQMFWHVSIPLARRGLVSGVLLAFARALGEFGATMMVFGWQPGKLTLPISVYADYEQGELSHATAAVVALSLISLSLVLAYNVTLARRRD